VSALTFVKVGKYQVPVVRAKFLTLVAFDGGEHGAGERGDFAFWTAVLKVPVKNGKKLRRVITGRAYAYLSPGDRFDRMAKEMRSAKRADYRAAYRKFWETLIQRGDNIAYIRPATAAELRRWINAHNDDGDHIYRTLIGGVEQ
jgi:hypothetical protein